MSKLDKIRTKIANKVFNKIGSTATLYSVQSSTIDKWGDATTTYSSGTSITIVPYNIISSRVSFEKFGDLKDGELDIVYSYDTSISPEDKITFDGVDYRVMQIEKYYYSDGVLAYVARIKKIQ